MNVSFLKWFSTNVRKYSTACSELLMSYNSDIFQNLIIFIGILNKHLKLHRLGTAFEGRYAQDVLYLSRD